MAFDGITIANIVKELNQTILDGRIYKIAQPETDELLLTIKTPKGQKRLCISASASLPLIYLTEENKPSHDGTEFLYAAQKICRKRKDRVDQSAEAGTDHPFRY